MILLDAIDLQEISINYYYSEKKNEIFAYSGKARREICMQLTHIPNNWRRSIDSEMRMNFPLFSLSRYTLLKCASFGSQFILIPLFFFVSRHYSDTSYWIHLILTHRMRSFKMQKKQISHFCLLKETSKQVTNSLYLFLYFSLSFSAELLLFTFSFSSIPTYNTQFRSFYRPSSSHHVWVWSFFPSSY